MFAPAALVIEGFSETSGTLLGRGDRCTRGMRGDTVRLRSGEALTRHRPLARGVETLLPAFPTALVHRLRRALLCCAVTLVWLVPAQHALSQAPVYHGRLNQVRVSVPRLADDPTVVDGVLDEAVWQRAAVLTGFSTYQPVDGRAADDSTEVLVWYSPSAINFGIRAFEPHGAVRATVANRDQIDSDDNIQILLDTFEDHRKAFVFAINALGAQADGIRSEGGGGGGPNVGGQSFGANPGQNIDLNPDYLFESKGRLTEYGYEIEVRIPFKSLRYPDRANGDWGLQVIRQVQHSGYFNTWTPAKRASASFLGQSGSLTGLTGLHRGLVLELTPELTTRVTGAAERANGAWAYSTDPQLGGNVRWGVTSDLTFDATAKPDFSQVEADATQIAADPRFTLFYPEKRPFFVDGIEQFDGPNRLIYTRRVLQPNGALKLTGKTGAMSIGALAAVDDRLASGSGRDHPLIGVLRLRRDLRSSSWMGLTYTGRQEPNHTSQLASMDVRLLFRKLYFAQFQAAGSSTRRNGASQNGPLWEAIVDRTGRNYGFHYQITGISPEFAAEAGFVPRIDFVKPSFFNRYTIFGPPRGWLETWVMRAGVDGTWTYDDFFRGRAVLEQHANWDNNITLRGGWTVGLTPNWYGIAFDPRRYASLAITRNAGTRVDTIPFSVSDRTRAFNVTARLQTPQFRRFAGSATVLTGQDIDFFETARAQRTDVTLGLDWRPIAQLRASPSFARSVYTRPDRSRFSSTTIPRLKVEYQRSRALLMRVVAQYDAEERDALRDPRTGRVLLVRSSASGYGASQRLASNGFRMDGLFSYQPTPGTVLFAGYGSSLTEPQPLRFSDLRRVGDGFFLKMSYVFRQ